MDPDYYDEDEDDLGDRLGQNAVLSLIGGSDWYVIFFGVIRLFYFLFKG